MEFFITTWYEINKIKVSTHKITLSAIQKINKKRINSPFKGKHFAKIKAFEALETGLIVVENVDFCFILCAWQRIDILESPDTIPLSAISRLD